MVTREDIVVEAISWVGTPWHHQATLKGVGADCLGLIRGVYINLGLLPPIKEWASLGISEKYSVYNRKSDNLTIFEGFDKYWIKKSISDMQIGDVVIFAIKGIAQHAGILVDYRHGGFSFIHSPNDRSRGTGMVSEHRLAPNIMNSVVAVYSAQGVD